MNRDQMIKELIAKKKAQQTKELRDYNKKISGLISGMLQAEYDRIVLGKTIKVFKKEAKREKNTRKFRE